MAFGCKWGQFLCMQKCPLPFGFHTYGWLITFHLPLSFLQCINGLPHAPAIQFPSPYNYSFSWASQPSEILYLTVHFLLLIFWPSSQSGLASWVCNLWSCTGSCGYRGPMLGLMLYHHHLQILNDFISVLCFSREVQWDNGVCILAVETGTIYMYLHHSLPFH